MIPYAFSIGTAIEKYWKDRIGDVIPNTPVFVSNRDESLEFEGSYIVCRVDSMEEIYAASNVYQADVQIWVISNSADVPFAHHDSLVDHVDHALLKHYNPSRIDDPNGLRVYGTGPRQRHSETLDDDYGAVFEFTGGYGSSFSAEGDFEPGYGGVGTAAEAYKMKSVWTELQKIDATAGAMTARIPANTIAHAAYTTNDGYALSVTINGSVKVFAIGESLNRDQVVLPSGDLAVHGLTLVHFPAGAMGTVSYVAAKNLGPIIVTED